MSLFLIVGLLAADPALRPVIDDLKARASLAAEERRVFDARGLYRRARILDRDDSEINRGLLKVEEACRRESERITAEARRAMEADTSEKPRREFRYAHVHGAERLTSEDLKAMLLQEETALPEIPDEVHFRPAPLPMDAKSLWLMARRAEASKDFLRARSLYETAVAAFPEDEALAMDLLRARVECDRTARNAIALAGSFLDAGKYFEALMTVALALEYAERGSNERQAAVDLDKAIRASIKR